MKIVIVGAGPAGTACAIALLQAGHQVSIIDKSSFPRPAPGETLHPGVEPLLQQLGVLGKLKQYDFLRMDGVLSRRGDGEIFMPYHDNEQWQGYQFIREDFDMALLAHAQSLGAEFYQANPQSIEHDNNGCIIALHCAEKRFEADYFIDASGQRRWLTQSLNIGTSPHSHQHIVYYGQLIVDVSERYHRPEMTWDEAGWTWIARIKNDRLSWARLDIHGHERKPRNWLPTQLHQYAGMNFSIRQARDMTWRIVDTPSQANYFAVGDAAFVLDPASSHGVLKALMSGIMVSHLIDNVGTLGNEAHTIYAQWLKQWFEGDVTKLRALYQNNHGS
ncbi:flavin-dependent dehydrogenase [Sinobacterium caligoides]|uniref:Flavin-dependent dehydrogenase n=1 Tax=Sinobacterium caligoides TaxID=933926 RepID=A0A3N2D563_9GAMM|nr:NAD(P)/FAD-dependent oxidoreductase [Sinobacterium caligoides]ROR94946.1 flavin-dependent dehydrogenase [Sinobacterium caligoides]